MPSPQGPLLPRRRLGAELRKLRGSRTLEEVAAETLISTSKLSRLENGQGVPQPRDIRDLIGFYDADRIASERIRRWMTEGRRQAWWKEYSDVISDSADIAFDYESGASVIRVFASLALPGLLQTEAYARALLTTILPQRTTAEIDKLVQLRLRRQEILLTGDPDPTRLLAVVDEAAVHRALSMGPATDGRAQLEHLREISRRLNVSVRIVPFTAGLHAAMLGMFEVFQFSDDMDRDVVHLESRSGDRYLEEQVSVLDHLRLFDSVSHRALDNSGSRNLLDQLLTAPPHPKDKK